MKNQEQALYGRITRTVREHSLYVPGDHIIMGISGGPDSLTMFRYFCDVAEEQQLRLHAVHVNHQLRGADADADEAFVRKICLDAGVPLDAVRFDCAAQARADGRTLEEAGRRKRYEIFDNVARRLVAEGACAGAIRIATAHNQDDQAETVLLRILRGTGADGLSGIEYGTEDEAGFRRIRPLLDVTRAEIRACCADREPAPRQDASNEDTAYARNRIRKELLPVLEEYNPNVRAALARLAGSAQEDRACFRDLAESAMESAMTGSDAQSITFSVEALRALPVAVRRRVYVLAFRKLGFTEDFTFSHLEQADAVLASDSPSAGVDLPHGVRVVRRYAEVRIANGDAGAESAELRVRICPVEEVDEKIGRDGRSAVLDLDRLREKYGADVAHRIVLRTRRAGDVLAVRRADGGVGRKKIQDFFVDRKVPKEVRDRIVLVTVGSDAIFIPKNENIGLRAQYAYDVSVNQHTKEALILETFLAL